MSATPTTQVPAQSVPDAFPEELVSSTLFLIKRLGMRAKEQSLVAYEGAGLHPYHHAILAVLDEGQRETQGAIADALGYDKGQLVGLLDELEDGGFIVRQRDRADRRRHVVEMTAAGRKALARARKLSARLDDEFLSSLGEKERVQLHALLMRLAEEHLPHCRFVQRRKA